MSTWILLVSAVLASLAAGVLLAYGVCQVMFAIFVSRARAITERRLEPKIASVAQIAEG